MRFSLIIEIPVPSCMSALMDPREHVQLLVDPWGNRF